MFVTQWSSNTNYSKVIARFRRALARLGWATACTVTLAVIAGMCSGRFEHFWEGLVVLNKL